VAENRNILSDQTARKLKNIEKIIDNFSVTGDATFKKTGTSWSIHVRPPKPARRTNVSEVEEDLGELDGMIPQMTSQNTRGWGDLRLVNRA
jgi:hypothetical protein